MFFENTRWSGDKDGSSIGIIFQKEKLEFGFSISCMYTFPIKIEGEEITMFWADEMDCTYETDLTKKFGLKEVPVIGKPFAIFNLVNDSTIHVDYLYEKWVEKYHLKIGWGAEKRTHRIFFHDSLFLISPDNFLTK